jgi:hypothetical protein
LQMTSKFSFSFEEKPFLVGIPGSQVIAVTKNKMTLFNYEHLLNPNWDDEMEDDLEQNNKKKAKKMPRKDEEVLFDLGQDYQLLGVKISPSFDTLYLLIQSQKQIKIAVLSVFDVNKKAILDDFTLTLGQFYGSTFSKQGRLFILPTEEGTLFFDMTQIMTPKEVAHWPLQSSHADVAGNGESICVALGMEGVYCGDLLF